MTSTEDLEKVISYLKTKATGTTVAEAEAVLGGKLLDGRKLGAYDTWGFVSRDGGRIRLTSRGRALARTSGESQQPIYSDCLRENRAYRLALEWLFHSAFQQVTNVEVAAYWHEHCPDELGSDNENTMRQQAVCFFNLADAAGLGNYLLGRRGQPTRLEIAQDALARFVGHAESTVLALDEESESSDELMLEEPVDDTKHPAGQGTTMAGTVVVGEPIRVFVAHGHNKDVASQVRTMLEFAGMECKIAEQEETTAIPVPEKVLGAMRECSAAVICVTVDERPGDGVQSYTVNENVLIEIGAAFVLYDRRVVLVWDRRVPVPSNLQGLYRCEFEGNELSWSAGMKLMEAVAGFRRAGRPNAA